MELSPKLESLSKVLQKLSEEVQRLESEKIRYDNLENEITRLDANQKILLGLILSLYISFLVIQCCLWVRKRNQNMSKMNLQCAQVDYDFRNFKT